MNRSEAEKTLAKHGYVVGKSSTRGMPEPQRSEIKAAIKAIRAAEMAELHAPKPEKKSSTPKKED